MMVSNFYPFIIVILQTILQNQREKILKKSSESSINSIDMSERFWTNQIDDDDIKFLRSFTSFLEIVCKVLLPFIGIVFVVGYFIFGCYVQNYIFRSSNNNKCTLTSYIQWNKVRSASILDTKGYFKTHIMWNIYKNYT